MEKANKKQKKEVILNDRFRLIKPLGKGQYSQVFHAIDLQSKEEVALKYQPKSVFHSSKTLLHNESIMLENLKNVSGVPIKKLFIEHNSHDLLILPIYKESLKDLYDRLDILEHIHEKNIIHLDLKPENIMIGTSDKTGNPLCIIDYGLARNYFDETKKSHIKCEKDNIFEGSYSYASLNSHLGLSQSRRDDFESLGYVLIYFLKGSLPWTFMTHENSDERMNKSKKLKKEISIESLCNGLPEKFKIYFKYVRELKFDEKPNYDFLRGLFKEMRKECGVGEFDKTDIHEWIEKENNSFLNFDDNEEYEDVSHKISHKYFADDTKFHCNRFRTIIQANDRKYPGSLQKK